jgi:hypothetical protein
MVPGIWIGVPMAAAGPLHLSSVDAMVGPYMAALASSFAAIVIVPLLAWIRGMARSWVVSAPAEAPKP